MGLKTKFNDYEQKLKEIDKKQFLKEHINYIIIALIVLIASVFIIRSSMNINRNQSISNGIVGTVSVKEVSLNTKIPGKIEEFYVEEGQSVKKGDALVKISSEELEAKKLQIEATVAQATAGVEAAKLTVEMAKSNYDLSNERVNQARAGVAASQSQKNMASAMDEKATNGAREQEVIQAQSAADLWNATYERAKILYDGGAISLQKLEEIEAQKNVANETLSMALEGARYEDKMAASAQVSLANAGVTASQATLNQALDAANIAMLQVNQAQEGLVAAEGQLEQAKAGLMEVEVYLNDTVLTAPMDGVVTGLYVDEGELISTGMSIGTVSDLNDCWVQINVDETEIGTLNFGDECNLEFLAFTNEEFTGKITTINANPDFAVKKAASQNGKLDIISYGVKIQLDNSKQQFRPGMNAIVTLK